jgi:hypothetical protein
MGFLNNYDTNLHRFQRCKLNIIQKDTLTISIFVFYNHTNLIILKN